MDRESMQLLDICCVSVEFAKRAKHQLLSTRIRICIVTDSRDGCYICKNHITF